MDGLFNAATAQKESTVQSSISKHRILRFNLSTTGLKNAADASSYGASDPTGLTPNALPEGGPHFILSPTTPDNSHTYGFEVAFSIAGIDPDQAAATTLTITPWILIGTGAQGVGAGRAFWAAMATITGASVDELYHSFDVNASAIRFQVDDGNVETGTSRSIICAFCEL